MITTLLNPAVASKLFGTPASLVPIPTTPTAGDWTVFAIEIILGILRSVAVALLSYRKYGSLLWAFIVFLFPDFYIVYYVYFLQGGMSGGRK